MVNSKRTEGMTAISRERGRGLLWAIEYECGSVCRLGALAAKKLTKSQ
jgi:hypothetical protein